MTNTMQVKRGLAVSLPTLAAGELGFSTDTKQVHVGDGSANHEVLMHDLFDATTFLYATSDNTPVAKTRAEVMGLLSGQASADFAMNTHKITGVVDPTSAQDVATKAYADGIAGGVDPKDSCRVATAAALPACTAAGSGAGKTLTANSIGVLTVDGVATVLNDRVLVKNQVAGDDNGIYKVTTEGTAGVAFILTRATDFDADTEVTGGAYCFITEGGTSADEGWILTTNDPITVDTTALAFSQFSGAGDIVAGSGMTKTGSTLNVIGGTGITANADDIEHDAHTGEVTGATALTIAADAVTYAKMQNVVADQRILGNIAGAGQLVAELTAAQVLTMISVESGADVTDVTNVTAAGAFMADCSVDLTGTSVTRDVDSSNILLSGGNTYGASIELNGKNMTAKNGLMTFNVPDAAKTGYVTAMVVPGATDTPVVDIYFGLDMNSKAITAVLDPTSAQHAATKNYCDTRTIDGGAFA